MDGFNPYESQRRARNCAHVSKSRDTREKKKRKVKPRQDLRILPILDVAVLPLNITNEHRTEFIRVVDAAETEIHCTSLGIGQYREMFGKFLATHLARNVVVRDLLDLTIAAGGNLVKLVHRDLQVNTHGPDNTSGTNGAAQGQLRADDVNLLADLDVDITLAKADTVRVLFVERLAGFMVAEVNISISERIDVDLLDSTTMYQRQHLGGDSPARRQSGEDDASHL